MCSCILKFWIIHVFENFISSIEILMIDNLVTYIENKNFKYFTIEDGEM